MRLHISIVRRDSLSKVCKSSISSKGECPMMFFSCWELGYDECPEQEKQMKLPLYMQEPTGPPSDENDELEDDTEDTEDEDDEDEDSSDESDEEETKQS